jgi:hypothetical protein
MKLAMKAEDLISRTFCVGRFLTSSTSVRVVSRAHRDHGASGRFTDWPPRIWLMKPTMRVSPNALIRSGG